MELNSFKCLCNIVIIYLTFCDVYSQSDVSSTSEIVNPPPPPISKTPEIPNDMALPPDIPTKVESPPEVPTKIKSRTEVENPGVPDSPIDPPPPDLLPPPPLLPDNVFTNEQTTDDTASELKFNSNFQPRAGGIPDAMKKALEEGKTVIVSEPKVRKTTPKPASSDMFEMSAFPEDLPNPPVIPDVKEKTATDPETNEEPPNTQVHLLPPAINIDQETPALNSGDVIKHTDMLPPPPAGPEHTDVLPPPPAGPGIPPPIAGLEPNILPPPPPRPNTQPEPPPPRPDTQPEPPPPQPDTQPEPPQIQPDIQTGPLPIQPEPPQIHPEPPRLQPDTQHEPPMLQPDTQPQPPQIQPDTQHGPPQIQSDTQPEPPPLQPEIQRQDALPPPPGPHVLAPPPIPEIPIEFPTPFEEPRETTNIPESVPGSVSIPFEQTLRRIPTPNQELEGLIDSSTSFNSSAISKIDKPQQPDGSLKTEMDSNVNEVPIFDPSFISDVKSTSGSDTLYPSELNAMSSAGQTTDQTATDGLNISSNGTKSLTENEPEAYVSNNSTEHVSLNTTVSMETDFSINQSTSRTKTLANKNFNPKMDEKDGDLSEKPTMPEPGDEINATVSESNQTNVLTNELRDQTEVISGTMSTEARANFSRSLVTTESDAVNTDNGTIVQSLETKISNHSDDNTMRPDTRQNISDRTADLKIVGDLTNVTAEGVKNLTDAHGTNLFANITAEDTIMSIGDVSNLIPEDFSAGGEAAITSEDLAMSTGNKDNVTTIDVMTSTSSKINKIVKDTIMDTRDEMNLTPEDVRQGVRERNSSAFNVSSAAFGNYTEFLLSLNWNEASPNNITYIDFNETTGSYVLPADFGFNDTYHTDEDWVHMNQSFIDNDQSNLTHTINDQQTGTSQSETRAQTTDPQTGTSKSETHAQTTDRQSGTVQSKTRGQITDQQNETSTLQPSDINVSHNITDQTDFTMPSDEVVSNVTSTEPDPESYIFTDQYSTENMAYENETLSQTVEHAQGQQINTSSSDNLHAPGTGTQDTRIGTQDHGIGTWEPETGSQDPGAGTQDHGIGTREPETGSQDPGAGTQDHGIGTREPETGSQDPGAGTQDHGIGTQDPGAGTQDHGIGAQGPGTSTQDPRAGTQDPRAGTQDTRLDIKDRQTGTQDPGAGTRQEEQTGAVDNVITESLQEHEKPPPERQESLPSVSNVVDIAPYSPDSPPLPPDEGVDTHEQPITPIDQHTDPYEAEKQNIQAVKIKPRKQTDVREFLKYLTKTHRAYENSPWTANTDKKSIKISKPVKIKKPEKTEKPEKINKPGIVPNNNDLVRKMVNAIEQAWSGGSQRHLFNVVSSQSRRMNENQASTGNTKTMTPKSGTNRNTPPVKKVKDEGKLIKDHEMNDRQSNSNPWMHDAMTKQALANTIQQTARRSGARRRMIPGVPYVLTRKRRNAIHQKPDPRDKTSSRNKRKKRVIYDVNKIAASFINQLRDKRFRSKNIGTDHLKPDILRQAIDLIKEVQREEEKKKPVLFNQGLSINDGHTDNTMSAMRGHQSVQLWNPATTINAGSHDNRKLRHKNDLSNQQSSVKLWDVNFSGQNGVIENGAINAINKHNLKLNSDRRPFHMFDAQKPSETFKTQKPKETHNFWKPTDIYDTHLKTEKSVDTSPSQRSYVSDSKMETNTDERGKMKREPVNGFNILKSINIADYKRFKWGRNRGSINLDPEIHHGKSSGSVSPSNEYNTRNKGMIETHPRVNEPDLYVPPSYRTPRFKPYRPIIPPTRNSIPQTLPGKSHDYFRQDNSVKTQTDRNDFGHVNSHSDLPRINVMSPRDLRVNKFRVNKVLLPEMPTFSSIPSLSRKQAIINNQNQQIKHHKAPVLQLNHKMDDIKPSAKTQLQYHGMKDIDTPDNQPESTYNKNDPPPPIDVGMPAFNGALFTVPYKPATPPPPPPAQDEAVPTADRRVLEASEYARTVISDLPTNKMVAEALVDRNSTEANTNDTIEADPSYAKELLNAEEICANCTYVSNFCYLREPTNCNRFIVCYQQGNKIRATEKECSFGLFWSESQLACSHPSRADCEIDPCKARGTRSHPYVGKCRAYWTCRRRRSDARCCPNGYAYGGGSSACVPDDTCKKDCYSKDTTSTNACPLVGLPDSTFEYFDGGMIRTCAPGTRFEQSACTCIRSNIGARPTEVTLQDSAPDIQCKPAVKLDFSGNTHDAFDDKSGNPQSIGVFDVVQTLKDQAMFNGRGSLKLWRFSNVELGPEFASRFKFYAVGQSHRSETLMSNCIGKSKPAFDIRIDTDILEIVFTVKTVDSPETTMRMFYQPNQWNEVILRYDGYSFSAALDNVSKTIFVEGSIPMKHAAISIGGCDQDDGFIGYMDDIVIYNKCIPGDVRNLVFE